MGLDMYLTGDKFVPEYQDKFPRAKVDSYPVESQRLKLGYWRATRLRYTPNAQI